MFLLPNHKAIIEKYVYMPMVEWPESLKTTFAAVDAQDRSSLQSLADLIELWVLNNQQPLTRADIFKDS